MTSRPCEAAQVTAQNMPRVCASLPMLPAQSASNTFATLFRICGVSSASTNKGSPATAPKPCPRCSTMIDALQVGTATAAIQKRESWRCSAFSVVFLDSASRVRRRISRSTDPKDSESASDLLRKPAKCDILVLLLASDAGAGCDQFFEILQELPVAQPQGQDVACRTCQSDAEQDHRRRLPCQDRAHDCNCRQHRSARNCRIQQLMKD